MVTPCLIMDDQRTIWAQTRWDVSKNTEFLVLFVLCWVFVAVSRLSLAGQAGAALQLQQRLLIAVAFLVEHRI